MPFVVRWPGRVKAGVSPALISQVDLAASLAALARVPLPDGAAPDSINVLPALLGDSVTGRDHAIIQGIQDFALREGPWKFIPPGHRDVRDGLDAIKQTRQQVNPPGLLFNLAADPAEREDLAARELERVAAMAQKLDQLRSAPAKP